MLIQLWSARISASASRALALIACSAFAQKTNSARCGQKGRWRLRKLSLRGPLATPQNAVDVSRCACLVKALPATVKREGGFGRGYDRGGASEEPCCSKKAWKLSVLY